MGANSFDILNKRKVSKPHGTGMSPVVCSNSLKLQYDTQIFGEKMSDSVSHLTRVFNHRLQPLI